MSDFLCRALKAYFESNPDITAVSIEQRVGIPNASISKMIQGSLPRVERLAQLLHAVPDQTARDWLVAYLRDHTPDDWQPRTQIAIDPAAHGLAETAAQYHVTRDRLTETLDWLRARSAGDDDLAEWLISTVGLMRGYITADQLPVGYAIAEIEVTADEAELIRAAATAEQAAMQEARKAAKLRKEQNDQALP